MAASSTDWESRARDEERFEADEQDSGGSSESDGEEDIYLSGVQAGEEMMETLLGLYYANKLTAKWLCIIAWWASRAGAAGPANKYAFRPNDPSTGHYQRHIDAVTGVSLRDPSAYRINVPGREKHDLGRASHATQVGFPLEDLEKELQDTPSVWDALDARLRDGQMPPAYTNHVVVARSAERVLPVGIFLDGVQFTKKNSILGIFMINLISHRRHLVAGLRKSTLCRCGCRTWCSIRPVMAYLHWCLVAMAEGMYPATRDDGRPWADDDPRKQRAGSPLPFKAALLWLKGDMIEYGGTLGFASFSTKCFPCIFCKTTEDHEFDVRGLSPVSFPAPLVTQDDYRRACEACEKHVVLDRGARASVAQLLRYDKRERGGRGRVLVVDMPALGLRAGDRLEPSAGCPDVGRFEALDQFPCPIVFWRRTEETRCRHRNPIFDASIGVTVDRVAIDILHSLYLGVAQTWASFAFQQILRANAYGIADRTTNERNAMAAARIGQDLKKFYSRLPQGSSKLEDFTLTTIGSKQLAAKGGETRCICPFVVELLYRFRAVLPEGQTLCASGDALLRLIALMDDKPSVMSAADAQEFCSCLKRFVVLAQAMGMPMQHKLHCMMHVANRILSEGNPSSYANWLDESLNRCLADAGRQSHVLVWTARLFMLFSTVESRRIAKIARRR